MFTIIHPGGVGESPSLEAAVLFAQELSEVVPGDVLVLGESGQVAGFQDGARTFPSTYTPEARAAWALNTAKAREARANKAAV
jgi:hypothetical protein